MWNTRLILAAALALPSAATAQTIDPNTQILSEGLNTVVIQLPPPIIFSPEIGQ